MDQAPNATLRDHLAVVRRYRWSVVLCMLLGIGAGLGVSLAQDEVYQAETSLSFREPTQDVELIGLPPVRVQTAEERAAVGAEEANRRELLEAVRGRLRIQEPLDAFDDRIEARAEVRTNLVVIQVRDGDPQQARRIAAALANEVVRTQRLAQQERFGDLIDAARRQARELRGTDPLTRLQRQNLRADIAQLRSVREVTVPAEVVETAAAANEPVSPKPVRNTLLGLATGLFLGMLLAFLRASLDRRLRSVREIDDEVDAPLLTVVRKQALGRAVMTAEGDDLTDLEAFRILRANLTYLDVDRDLRRVVVTSPLPEEGKSTVSSSLALAAAIAGRRTLLIGGDLRRPKLGERLGLRERPGLTDYLAGEAQPSEVVQVVRVPGAATRNGSTSDGGEQSLAFIGAGSQVPRPAELLASERFARFMHDVGEVYDLVVIDSAPLLSIVDTLEIIEHADAAILCVRSNWTTRDQLRSAMEALQRVGERPVGLVATGIEPGADGDYGYYTYSYSYADQH